MTNPLAELDQVFTRWLGPEYDLDAIHATLAAAAVSRLDGDPLWILLVSGPGNAKTETVTALGTSGAHIVSTISSPGALLSATSKGERADDATGGLLCEIGKQGVIVLKEFTSILSLPPSTRPEVMAALREIYDGYWKRTVGADGGRTLTWQGRVAVIGAVTTEWDRAYAAVSSMGDRFVLLRMDSTKHRLAGGRQAIGNTGSETQMRAELAQAAAHVLDRMCLRPITLTHAETEVLLAAADLVTLARTAVMRDGKGEPTDAHAPEMPTRFAKQLAQIIRGGVAIGMDRRAAMCLAIRCARDSVPPLRLKILRYLTEHPDALVSEVRNQLDKPHNTVDRELQALHILGLVTLHEETFQNHRNEERTRWKYSLNGEINTAAVFPEIYVPPHPQGRVCVSTYIPGNAEPPDHGSTYIPGNAKELISP